MFAGARGCGVEAQTVPKGVHQPALNATVQVLFRPVDQLSELACSMQISKSCVREIQSEVGVVLFVTERANEL